MKHWKVYEPNTKQPWNWKRAWTLHRRAGYAATWSELQRDVEDGPRQSIARFFDAAARMDGVPNNYDEMSGIIGDSAVTSNRPERLMAWWMYHMYFTPDPLRERMATMWHNHFATSQAKVKSLALMRDQNEVFRRHAADDFRTLLAATLKHGAMLKWLDGDENRAGQANENLGRETLELFTLGIGNYTEQDVKEVSRALTGWSVHKAKFRIRQDWHDAETKTILGKSGKFMGDDVIEITTKHPATAKRLAWRLCHEFLAESLVSEPRCDELAAWLSQNQLDIGGATRIILQSDVFYSDDNLKRRIIEPESFVIGAVRALEVFAPPASTLVLADWNEQLGRKLFFPPNVGGWSGGRAWLNSRTAIARANFGVSLVNGSLGRSGQAPDLIAQADRHGHSTKLPDLVSFFGKLLTGDELTKQTDEIVNLASSGTKNKREIARNLVSLILASPAAQLS